MYHMSRRVGIAMMTSARTEAPIRPTSTKGLPWPCGGGSACSSASLLALNLIMAYASAPPTKMKITKVTQHVR